MPRSIRPFLKSLAALLLLTAPCAANDEAAPKAGYNVVMIVLDACRKDHLGCYGYKRKIIGENSGQASPTPRIDDFAKHAVVFEQAFAQSNLTLSSFSSFLTSKYPSAAGVHFTPPPRPGGRPSVSCLGEDELTLAEILKLFGYHTAAFPTGTHLDPKFRLNQGFDIYANRPFDVKNVSYLDFDPAAMSFADILPPALKWLEANKNKRFFLLLHSNDTHPPYDPPDSGFVHRYDPGYSGAMDKFVFTMPLLRSINNGILEINDIKPKRDVREPFRTELSRGELKRKGDIRLTPRDIEHIIAHYDGSLSYADDRVGKTLEELTRLGLDKNTIVLLMADHGESLYERKRFDRNVALNLHDEILKVPLLIRHPGLKTPAGTRIKETVQLLDIMPTLLSFLGISAPDNIQGRDLSPLINAYAAGKAPKEAADAQNGYTYAETSTNKFSIRNSRWKLIRRGKETELYDLAADPGETRNLIKTEISTAQKLMKELDAWNTANLKIFSPALPEPPGSR